ncbi:DUF5067 domain-containing protein [Virgibacillus pantothenticus]|uniref:DUF5067 domain-containing protein n=1 Tax=Virgibacillus pantothenticus TaxID=1473 RepID=UPI00148034D5|nr:DUF5067 domain-containing protein [Virgibacillus pantothenticus]
MSKIKGIVAVTAILGVFLVGCGSKEENSSSSVDVKNEDIKQEEPEKGTNKVSDSVVESEYNKIEIKEVEQIENELDGSPLLAVEVKYTNKEDKPSEPWNFSTLTMDVIQETDSTYEKLEGELSGIPNDYKPDKVEMARTDVKSGATVDVVLVYEIKNPGEPVKLINFDGLEEDLTFEKVIQTTE